MSIRKFRSARVNTTTANIYVGQHGDIFYDEDTGQLKVSDGATPGGHYIPLVIATPTVAGAIKAGPGANVSVDGTLTINTVGLPLSFGDFTATGGNLTVVNPNEDMSLVTNGTANVNIIGNLRLLSTSAGPYTVTPIMSADNSGRVTINGDVITDGNLTAVGNVQFVGNTTHNGNLTANGNLTINGPSYFFGNVTEIGNLAVTGNAVNNGYSVFNGATTFNGNIDITGVLHQSGDDYITGNMYIAGNTVQTGRKTLIVSTVNSSTGAMEITGNAQGLYQTPVNTGAMLQITGIDDGNTVSRLYNDSIGQYALFAGRRYNGNIANPTQVLANQDIARFAATGYTSSGWATIGPSRISFVASENLTSTNQGGRIEFWSTANGTVASTSIQRIATVDAAVGVSATQFTASGNVTVGNAIVYTTATNDAGNVTQLTSKTTSVTANGRTGRIVMNNSSLAQNSNATFTVNNSYVTYRDAVICNIQQPVTQNAYLVSVTTINSGSFNITLRNTTNGALSDAVVLNFSIIKVV